MGQLRQTFKVSVLLCLLTILIAGCGGGGGSTNGVTTVRVSIAWAARGRTLNAPSSALSAVITLKKAKSDGTDFTYTINRDTAPAAYTQTYISTDTAKTGTWPMTAAFYAQADGGGAVVGTAAANVTLLSDGSGIGNIATTGVIASVALNSGQIVPVGQTAYVAFTAYDANNNIVVVSPGSGSFTQVSGQQYVTINNGIAQGVSVGAASVTVTVDGKTSAPGTISASGTVNGLEPVGFSNYYGDVRVRIKGLVAANTPVSVTVGGVASPLAALAYTDSNAPATSATKGGAIEFQVPYGLSSGSQNIVVTVGGAVQPPIPVTVSDTNPFAVFSLANGNNFVAELRQDKAPNTVANFVGLATGAKTYTDPCTNMQSNAPLYNGVTFHRCIPGFVWQAGDPLSKCKQAGDPSIGSGSIGFTIPFEVNSLTNVNGALAMARASDLNSASSQFFIDNGNHPELNTTLDQNGNPTGGYVVFGQLVEGAFALQGIALTQDANGNPTGATPTILARVAITGKLDTPQ